MLAAGNALGNHTYSHPYLERLSAGEVRRELNDCNEAMRSLVGVRSYLFRPPRGNWNPLVFQCVREQGDRIILWSIALEHQAIHEPKLMAQRVLASVRPGDVILMHDGANVSRELTVQALPILLEGLRERGYRFATVSALFGIRGCEPVPQSALSSTPVRPALEKGS